MAFVKVKESARQSDDGYKCQKPDHFSLVVEKNEVAKSEYNRPTASPRWTRTKAMSDTGEAIGFAYLRNGTRLLSLMSRMRVRSGPGCGASGVRRSPPVGAECSSAVAALHVCVCPLTAGCLTSRSQISFSLPRVWAPMRNELLAEYYLRAAGIAAVWVDATGHVGAQRMSRRSRLSPISRHRSIAASTVVPISSWRIGCTNGRRPSVDLAAIVAKLEELADRGGN